MARMEIYGGINAQDLSAGGKLFDGSGPPINVIGAREGDYYLDIDTGKVYKLTWEEGD